MARSAVNIGLPNPNYVTELGKRDAILPGTYEIEQGALSATSSTTIANLTLAATAAAIDGATLAQTISALTLAATATGTVSASLSATLADLTLSAGGAVIDRAALSATIGDPTLSATVAATDSVSLAATIDPLTLAATVAVIATAAVDATIGAFTLSATATSAAVRGRDGIFPWWWAQYVARHEAERRAAEDKARQERELWRADHAVEGDGYALAPAPAAHGEAEHIPPSHDEIAVLTAICCLLTTDGAPDELAGDFPGFWEPGEAATAHPDDDATIATAVSLLLQTRCVSPAAHGPLIQIRELENA